MRKTSSGTGSRTVDFDAADFPSLPKVAGIVINTIIMGHATASENVVVTISNDGGVVASVSSIGAPMWLKDLSLFVQLADATDAVDITAAGETATATLTVEAGPIGG